MLERCDYKEARDILLKNAGVVPTFFLPLSSCFGKIIARDVYARVDVPSFYRSPYDGYAFSSQDTRQASDLSPVKLRVVEKVAAGETPKKRLHRGEASNIMTGAMLPEGADAVLPFEETVICEEEDGTYVYINRSVAEGKNVICPGEDVRKGEKLIEKGCRIDGTVGGILASQGIFSAEVYRKPVVGIISTGTELLDDTEEPVPGKIYNTNRYVLSGICEKNGCQPHYYGIVGDSSRDIAERIRQALSECDALFLSGGVSVGEFDCTPEAFQLAGVETLVRGIAMKPGMAGVYGIYDRKPVFGFSGNPAACMVGALLIAVPVLRKMAGKSDVQPVMVKAKAYTDYSKPRRKDLQRRKDMTAGKDVTAIKDVTASKDMTSSKDVTSSRYETGSKDETSQKDVLTRKDAMSSKDVTVFSSSQGIGAYPSVKRHVSDVWSDTYKRRGITRILRGKLHMEDGEIWIKFPEGQGNQMLHSFLSCDLLAELPPGGLVRRGDLLDCTLITE